VYDDVPVQSKVQKKKLQDEKTKAFLDAMMNEGALVYDDVPVQSKVSKVQKKKKTKAFLDD
jgi:hypothetical protein